MPWWYARRDTVSISRFARRATEVARTSESGIAVLRARYFGAASEGYLALARGDSAEAERLFTAIPDTLCMVGTCFHEQLVLARLLVARGEYRRAGEILDHWGRAGGNTTLAVMAALERGQIAERLGDGATAVERYQFVIDVWRRADPELQPFVSEARAGLERHRR